MEPILTQNRRYSFFNDMGRDETSPAWRKFGFGRLPKNPSIIPRPGKMMNQENVLQQGDSSHEAASFALNRYSSRRWSTICKSPRSLNAIPIQFEMCFSNLDRFQISMLWGISNRVDIQEGKQVSFNARRPHKLYVIIEGEVELIEQKLSKVRINEENDTQQTTYGPGTMLGLPKEGHDTPQHGLVKAKMATIIATIAWDAYKKIARHGALQREYRQEMEKIHWLSSCNDDQLQILSETIDAKKYEFGWKVYDLKEQPEYFYIVRSGIFEVQVVSTDNDVDDQQKLVQSFGVMHSLKGETILTAGCFFGEQEIFNGDKERQTCVICKAAEGSLFVIEKEQFLRLDFLVNLLEKFHKSQQTEPRSKLKWEPIETIPKDQIDQITAVASLLSGYRSGIQDPATNIKSISIPQIKLKSILESNDSAINRTTFITSPANHNDVKIKSHYFDRKDAEFRIKSRSIILDSSQLNTLTNKDNLTKTGDVDANDRIILRKLPKIISWHEQAIDGNKLQNDSGKRNIFNNALKLLPVSTHSPQSVSTIDKPIFISAFQRQGDKNLPVLIQPIKNMKADNYWRRAEMSLDKPVQSQTFQKHYGPEDLYGWTHSTASKKGIVIFHGSNVAPSMLRQKQLQAHAESTRNDRSLSLDQAIQIAKQKYGTNRGKGQ